MLALQESDADTLDRTAGAIRGRCARVCNVVTAEMDNYEPGDYTDRVMEAVYMLRDQGIILKMIVYASVYLVFLIILRLSSPVKRRDMGLSLSVRPSVRPSVCLSVPLDIG